MINHLKLRWKITIIVILILLLVMIVVSTANYFYTSNIIRKEVTSNIQTTFSLFKIRIDNFFEKIENTSFKIIKNDSIKTYLEIVNFRFQKLVFQQKLVVSTQNNNAVIEEELKLNSIINSNLENYIVNLIWMELKHLESIDFFYLTLSNGYVIAENYRNNINISHNNLKGAILKKSEYNRNDFNSIKYINEIPYLLFKSKINSNNKVIGHLVLGISLKKLNQKINFNIGAYSSDISILNQNKYVISNQNSANLAKKTNNKKIIQYINDNYFPINKVYKNTFLIMDKIDSNNLYLAGELVRDSIFAPAKKIRIINIYILVIVIILSFFIIYITMSWQLHPLNILIKKMQEIKNGNLDTKLPVKTNDEIGTLSNEFNNMTFELKELMKKVKNDQEEIRKLELSALQQQINPHFLYNTLDSISLMTKTGEYNEIAEMCISLSQFFRLGLNKGKDFYTINEEINHVKNYINIQKLRFPDKFEYHFKIDNDIRNYKCVKIILQPIIENSLKHGFKFNKSKGHILVEGYKENSNIILRIMDDGSGFNSEFIKEFNQENNQQGYGLNNVRRRIKLYHGNNYGLQISNSINTGGAIATITLPAAKKEYKNV